MSNEKHILALLRKAKKDPKTIYELSENLLADIVDAVSKSHSIACRKSCAHCCYLRVSAYDYELVTIYKYLTEKVSKVQRELLIESVNEQYENVRGMTLKEHHHTNVKCPFLVNNSCTIYPVRPLSCAAYHSRSESICKRSYDNPSDESFSIPLDPHIESLRVNKHIFVQNKLEKDNEGHELIQGIYRMIHNKNSLKEWKNIKT
ncbi:YkgJ family cysteine cluster protein [Serratia sp. JSRIV004]|uniref:YkgJ family cysteine cluster protein n=1 Tax=Serratia sp. JSRIV004 TaxID=2831895 RepID=UPI001CBB5FFA|nr:YkgJ family cysteine cluster protein [Serratia sp. JSRIV004]UAN60152.1 YkgJ family cysteine cluster protein [Serratia sp. JSRIV004]